MLERFNIDIASKLFSVDTTQQGRLRPAVFEMIIHENYVGMDQSKLSQLIQCYQSTEQGSPFVDYKMFLSDMSHMSNALEALEKLHTEILNQMKSGQTSFYKTFMVADSNKSGAVNYKEFENLLQKSRISILPEEAQAAFQILDLNGDGDLIFSEFEKGLKRVADKKGWDVPELASSQRNQRVLVPFDERNVEAFSGLEFMHKFHKFFLSSKYRDCFEYFKTFGMNPLTKNISRADFRRALEAFSKEDVTEEILSLLYNEMETGGPALTVEKFQNIYEKTSKLDSWSSWASLSGNPLAKDLLDKIITQVNLKYFTGFPEFLKVNGDFNDSIPRYKFLGCLNSIGLVLTPDDELILNQNFATSGDNYTTKLMKKYSEERHPSFKPPGAISLDPLLDEIARFLQTSGKDLFHECQTSDWNSTGRIHINKFLDILAQNNIRPAPSEVEQILLSYGEGIGDRLINYRFLSNDINTRRPKFSQFPTPSPSQSGFPKEKKEELKQMWYTAIISNNKSVDKYLKDIDIDQSGYLDKSELMKSISRLLPKLTRAEMDFLISDLEKDGRNGKIMFHSVREYFLPLNEHSLRQYIQRIMDSLRQKNHNLENEARRYFTSGDVKVDDLANFMEVECGFLFNETHFLVENFDLTLNGVRPVFSWLLFIEKIAEKTEKLGVLGSSREISEFILQKRDESVNVNDVINSVKTKMGINCYADAMRVFETYDKDHNGFIELNEFQILLANHASHLSAAQRQRVLDTFDQRNTKKISQQDFLRRLGFEPFPLSSGSSQVSSGLIVTLEWARPVFKQVYEALRRRNLILDYLFPGIKDGRVEIYELKSVLRNNGIEINSDLNNILNKFSISEDPNKVNFPTFLEVYRHFTTEKSDDFSEELKQMAFKVKNALKERKATFNSIFRAKDTRFSGEITTEDVRRSLYSDLGLTYDPNFENMLNRQMARQGKVSLLDLEKLFGDGNAMQEENNVTSFLRNFRNAAASNTVDLASLFRKIDMSMDGFLQREEFVKFLRLYDPSLTERDALELFEQIDKNDDMNISLREFLDFFNLSNFDPEILSVASRLEWAGPHFEEINRKLAFKNQAAKNVFLNEGEELQVWRMKQGLRELDVVLDGPTMDRFIKDLVNSRSSISWTLFLLLLERFKPFGTSSQPGFAQLEEKKVFDSKMEACVSELAQRAKEQGLSPASLFGGMETTQWKSEGLVTDDIERAFGMRLNYAWSSMLRFYSNKNQEVDLKRLGFDMETLENISSLILSKHNGDPSRAGRAIFQEAQSMEKASFLSALQLMLPEQNESSLMCFFGQAPKRSAYGITFTEFMESLQRSGVPKGASLEQRVEKIKETLKRNLYGLRDYFSRRDQQRNRLGSKQDLTAFLNSQGDRATVMEVEVALKRLGVWLIPPQDKFDYESLISTVMASAAISNASSTSPNNRREGNKDPSNKAWFSSASQDPQFDGMVNSIKAKIIDQQGFIQKIQRHDTQRIGLIGLGSLNQELREIGASFSSSELELLFSKLSPNATRQVRIKDVLSLFGIPSFHTPKFFEMAEGTSGDSLMSSQRPQRLEEGGAKPTQKEKEQIRRKLVETMKKLKINSATMFRRMDQDCDQVLSFAEFELAEAFRSENISRKAFEEAFREINESKSGFLTLQEFKKFVLLTENLRSKKQNGGPGGDSEHWAVLNKIKGKMNMDRVNIRDLFKKHSRESSELSEKEFFNAIDELSADLAPIEEELLFTLFDADGNGQISMEEFTHLVQEDASFTLDANGIRLKIFEYLRKLGAANGLRSLFSQITGGQNKEMNQKQFKEFLNTIGAGHLQAKEQEYFFKKVNTNGNWLISFEELSGFYDESSVADLLPGLLELRTKVAGQMQKSGQPMNVAFRRFDKDGDGYLNKSEFKDMLTALGITGLAPDDIETLFGFMDLDRDYRLSGEEFHKAIVGSKVIDVLVLVSRVQSQILVRRTSLKALMMEFDVDRDSFLSFREFHEMIGSLKVKLNYFEETELFKFLDKDKLEKLSHADLAPFEPEMSPATLDIRDMERINPDYAKVYSSGLNQERLSDINGFKGSFPMFSMDNVLQTGDNSAPVLHGRGSFGKPSPSVPPQESLSASIPPGRSIMRQMSSTLKQFAKLLTATIDIEAARIPRGQGKPQSQIQAFFNRFDYDRDSLLSFAEFREVCIEIGLLVNTLMQNAVAGLFQEINQSRQAGICFKDFESVFLHQDTFSFELVKDFAKKVTAQLVPLTLDQLIAGFDDDQDRQLSKKEFAMLAKDILSEVTPSSLEAMFNYINISLEMNLTFNDLKHAIMPLESPYIVQDKSLMNEPANQPILEELARNISWFMARRRIFALEDLLRKYEGSSSGALSKSELLNLLQEVLDVSSALKQNQDFLVQALDPLSRGYAERRELLEKLEPLVDSPKRLLSLIKLSLGSMTLRSNIGVQLDQYGECDQGTFEWLLKKTVPTFTPTQISLVFEYFGGPKRGGRVGLGEIDSALLDSRIATSSSKNESNLPALTSRLSFGAESSPVLSIVEQFAVDLQGFPESRGLLEKVPHSRGFVSMKDFSEFCQKNLPTFDKRMIQELFKSYKNDNWLNIDTLLSEVDSLAQARSAFEGFEPAKPLPIPVDKLKRELDRAPVAKRQWRSMKQTNKFLARTDFIRFCQENNLTLSIDDIAALFAHYGNKDWVDFQKITTDLVSSIPQATQNLASCIRPVSSSVTSLLSMIPTQTGGFTTQRALENFVQKHIPNFSNVLGLVTAYMANNNADSILLSSIIGDLALIGIQVQNESAQESQFGFTKEEFTGDSSAPLKDQSPVQKFMGEVNRVPGATEALKGLPTQNTYVSIQSIRTFCKNHRLSFTERDISALFSHFNNPHWIPLKSLLIVEEDQPFIANPSVSVDDQPLKAIEKLAKELAKLPKGPGILQSLPQQNTWVSLKNFKEFVWKNKLAFYEEDIVELYKQFKNDNWLPIKSVQSECEKISSMASGEIKLRSFGKKVSMKEIASAIEEQMNMKYSSGVDFFNGFSMGKPTMRYTQYCDMMGKLGFVPMEEPERKRIFNEIDKEKKGYLTYESLLKAMYPFLVQHYQLVKQIIGVLSSKNTTLERALTQSAARVRGTCTHRCMVNMATLRSFLAEDVKVDVSNKDVQELISSLRHPSIMDTYNLASIHYSSAIFKEEQAERSELPLLQVGEPVSGTNSQNKKGYSMERGGHQERDKTRTASESNPIINKILSQVAQAMNEDKLSLEKVITDLDRSQTGFCSEWDVDKLIHSTLGFEKSGETRQLIEFLKEASTRKVNLRKLEEGLLANGLQGPRKGFSSFSAASNSAAHPVNPESMLTGASRVGVVAQVPVERAMDEAMTKKVNLIRNFFKRNKGMENRDVYDFYDKRKEGFLTKEQFCLESQKMNIPGLILKDFEDIFTYMDANKNSRVTLAEFRYVFYDKTITSEQKKMANMNHLIRNELHEIFGMFDANGNGEIDEAELEGMFRRMGINPETNEIKGYLRQFDMNGDGKISEEEFIKIMDMKLKREIINLDELLENLMQIRENFKKIDVYGTRQLNLHQFKQLLINIDVYLSEEELIGLFQDLDTNQNGLIDIDELISYLRKSNEEFSDPLVLNAVLNIKRANAMTPKELMRLFDKLPSNFCTSFLWKQFKKGKHLPSEWWIPQRSKIGFAYKDIVPNLLNPTLYSPLKPLLNPAVGLEITLTIAKGIPMPSKKEVNYKDTILARHLNICLFNRNTGKFIGGSIILPAGLVNNSREDEWQFKTERDFESNQILVRLDTYDKVKDAGLQILFEFVVIISREKNSLQMSSGWCTADISALLEQHKLSLQIEGGDPTGYVKINQKDVRAKKSLFSSGKPVNSALEISVQRQIKDVYTQNMNFLPPKVILQKSFLSLAIAYRFYLGGQLTGLSHAINKDLQSNVIVRSFLRIMNCPLQFRKLVEIWNRVVQPNITLKEKVIKNIGFFELTIEKIYFLLSCQEFHFVSTDQTQEYYHVPEAFAQREKLTKVILDNIDKEIKFTCSKGSKGVIRDKGTGQKISSPDVLPVNIKEMNAGKEFSILELIEDPGTTQSELDFLESFRAAERT